jgi:CRP/FNR family transcriptional regulator, cyclic AMP receptor protein
MSLVAASKKLSKFDPKTFLSTINGGKKIEAFPKKQTIFAQGDSSDAVFYINEGKVKLTVMVYRVRSDLKPVGTRLPRVVEES